MQQAGALRGSRIRRCAPHKNTHITPQQQREEENAFDWSMPCAPLVVALVAVLALAVDAALPPYPLAPELALAQQYAYAAPGTPPVLSRACALPDSLSHSQPRPPRAPTRPCTSRPSLALWTISASSRTRMHPARSMARSLIHTPALRSSTAPHVSPMQQQLC
jgi:hypothetical protein